MNNPIHISDAEFEEKVMRSKLPVIVDFWAPWCGPCRMIAPVLEDIARQYAGRLVVAKVNTDESPEWAVRLGIQGIPTLLFVANGKIVNRLVGAAPRPVIKGMAEELLEDSQMDRAPVK